MARGVLLRVMDWPMTSRLAAVVTLPESVGQDHIGRRGGEIFAGLKHTPKGRGNAKGLEEVVADSRGRDHLWAAGFSQDGIATATVGCHG